jgi:hypothetical protein
VPDQRPGATNARGELAGKRRAPFRGRKGTVKPVRQRNWREIKNSDKMKTDRAEQITSIAKTQPGFVSAGIGMAHESGFWGCVFKCETGWLRVVFADFAAYRAFEKVLVTAMPDDEEVRRQTKPIDPATFSWNKSKNWRTKQEQIIRENHDADVQNGLSHADASASDAFERRVLGID